MNLMEFINRPSTASPWVEGDNIPWSDPEFSARMLREHLSQEHDAASRRSFIIDQHVGWIHTQLLRGKPTGILDLGCGPGLYANRLAVLGHTCTGIDYSPASIAFAIQTAKENSVNSVFIEQDIRKADYGEDYGLVMLVFGELNVFKPVDARLLLQKAYHALRSGGFLLLEPHTFDEVQRLGQLPTSWSTHRAGLFSDRPYLYLQEHFWDPVACAATTRHIIVDAVTQDFHWYASSMQAYTEGEYGWLLHDCGFKDIQFYPSLGNISTQNNFNLIAISAQKE